MHPLGAKSLLVRMYGPGGLSRAVLSRPVYRDSAARFWVDWLGGKKRVFQTKQGFAMTVRL